MWVVSNIFIFNKALKNILLLLYKYYYIILYKNFISKGLYHWTQSKITKEERKEEEKVTYVFLECHHLTLIYKLWNLVFSSLVFFIFTKRHSNPLISSLILVQT